jgi:hypothetical protein
MLDQSKPKRVDVENDGLIVVPDDQGDMAN